MATCGPTGAGKSYSSMRLGEILMGERFNPAKHIAYFDPWDFVEKVKKSQPGDYLIFDEAGVGIDSRQWAKKSNILMTQLLQTFRTKNLFIVFTAPDFTFVDTKARKLFHLFNRSIRIDRKKQQTISKIYELQGDPYEGNYWRKTLTININQIPHEISQIRLSRVSKENERIYEENRACALDKLFKEAEEIENNNGMFITVDQAGKTMPMDNQELWQLIARGKIPISREHSSPKVSLKFVREVIKVLKPQLKLNTITSRNEADVNKKLPHYELSGGTFLVLDAPDIFTPAKHKS